MEQDNSFFDFFKWDANFLVIPEDAPKLVEVPRLGGNVSKVNPIVYVQICEACSLRISPELCTTLGHFVSSSLGLFIVTT